MLWLWCCWLLIEDSSKDVSDVHAASSNKYISILPEDMINRVRDSINSKSRELFSECQEEVKKFLSEEPYTEFRRSMYFHRYLQWKYLESQPVTYKTFRMYRVLGEKNVSCLIPTVEQSLKQINKKNSLWESNIINNQSLLRKVH